MKIVIILPTYNEKENISLMIDALLKQFAQISHHMSILVVDDNSPDGTADVVRAARSKVPNVFLLTGEKRGLGAAYIRGMKHAIDVLHADVVMEMDSDFSHKPEDVPRLIEAIDQGADFVIGSRYIPGGCIPQDWGLLRRMISKWGNVFARYVAGIYRVRDCTAGFRAIRADVIKRIDLDGLRVRGYAFQISLLHEAIVNGAIVSEIPVHFVDRKRGNTKMGISDIGEFMLNAWWIRFERSKTFLKFLVVGASGVIVNLVLFTLLMNAGISKFLASPIAIEISIITNFLLNNYWTFSKRVMNDKLHIRGLKFNIISFAALVVSYTTFLLLSAFDPRGIPQVHQAVGIVPATLVNYFLNSYWTFKKPGPQ
ncbi:MAG TPA: glycosyltransferase family 2 protein [Nitrospirota bacterium]|nr:glycosyltransferase family 2 protein [Nitrospirota bacterium]